MSSSYRSEQLQRVAFDLDMQYHPDDRLGTKALLLDFKLFRRGRSKKIFNHLRRIDEFLEVDVRIFDYRYVIGSNNARRKVFQTVFFVQSRHLALPIFWMKPENFFHKIAEALGMSSDIDFEEFPDFSSRYRLKGPEEGLIRNSFSEEIIRFFSVEENWSLEGINYFLIFYRQNKLLSPKQIRDFYRHGIRLFQLFSELPSGEKGPA